MLNHLKLTAMWRERLWHRPQRNFRQACVREWTRQPAEVQRCAPSIYFPEQVDRVSAVQEETNWETEIRRLRGGATEHEATRAYLLRNVELIDAWIYSGPLRDKLAHRDQHLFVPPSREKVGKAFLASSLPGNTYFGHWLTDDLLLYQAAKELAPPVMVERGISYSHEAGYCRLLDVAQHKLERAHIRELTVLDDRGQNAHKRQRYQELRSALRRAVPDRGAERVYIRRGINGASPGRKLVNAADIENFLCSQGFVIVDPDTQSAQEIARATMDARIVVGVEGSHLSHGIMPLADGGTLWCLQPPYRFNNVYKDIADAIYAHYALLIGIETEGGFLIPIDEMKRMLDRLHRPRIALH